MTRAKRRLQEYLPLRIVSASEVAHHLVCSEATQRKLLAIGFPDCNKLLCGYDLKAVELWLDERSGIGEGEFEPHLAKLGKSLVTRTVH